MRPIPGRRKAGTQVVVSPANGRVIRYRVDSVGNDLTAWLAWCETHAEPVWVYGDDSWTCPHTVTVQWDTEDHVLVPGPWESPGGTDEGATTDG